MATASAGVCRRIAASVVEPTEPERDHRDGGELGVLVEHTGHRPLEHVAVVDPGAQHDLAVHLDAVIQQRPEPAQAHPATRVLQHPRPNLGVGGVDADVQRRQALGDDALQVGLGEARQGGEVPVEEAQAVVVVLEVQAAAQARRQLVDEAELAVVVAGAHPVEHRAGHLGAERLAGALADEDVQLHPAAPHGQLDLGLVDGEAPLDDVARHRPVDGDDLVAGEHAGARRGRAVGDGDDGRAVRRPTAAGEAGRGGARRRRRHGNGHGLRGYRRGVIGSLGTVDVDRVLLAEPRGFCAGVEMAIKALAWMVRSFEAPVYCYHEIVHNKAVVDRFVEQGVVFVDDIADVPPGRPIMLSAHGSAPEVVAAARERGSYVVDSVCPLVTKVHHEVKVRAGRGFRIVYVGHEGHEEAVGTMAVAPQSISRVESVAEVDGAAVVRRACRAARPDDAVAPRLGRRRRRRQAPLPRCVDARPQRPVLRHDEPPVGVDEHGRTLRRGRGDRLGELVEHPGVGQAGRGRWAAGVPRQRRRRAARRPVRHRRRHRRRVGTRGTGRCGDQAAGAQPGRGGRSP